MYTAITTLAAFIFVLGILVFVHEFGHFIFAKLLGVRVERFSIGFPPRAFGFKYGDTDYCFSWIPLGGYCKMAGMVDESLDTDSIKGEPWEFQSKPLWRKALIIAAGPGMNFVLAIIIFFFIALAFGLQQPIPVDEAQEVRIGEVFSGEPAALAGLQKGDLITKVDGQTISDWESLTKIIYPKINEQILIEWVRDGEEMSATITTISKKVFNDEKGVFEELGMIGISAVQEFETINVGIIGAFSYGLGRFHYMLRLIFVSIKMIVTGEESIRSLGGPIIIAKMAGETARSSILDLFYFMAFLSINLGLINLFPVPVLDGGHLVFIGVEGIIRRQVPVKFKIILQQIGMALLLLLISYVIYNDIVRWVGEPK